MTENTFAFGDDFTQTDGKTEMPEHPAYASLYEQKCHPEKIASVTSRIFSVKETDVIQCEKNISESENSAEIRTSEENLCSASSSTISDTANYLCPMCSKWYTYAKNLKNHMASTHKIGNYECLFCHRIFALASLFREHTERHTNVHIRPYNCTICQSSFKTKECVVKHKNKVHSEKKFECNTCNLVYFRRASLLRHQSVHHKVWD